MVTANREDAALAGTVGKLLRRIARGATLTPAPEPGVRRECRPRQLDDAAVALRERLPPQLRLTELRGAYPRVLNRVALAWDDPRAFDALIDSLLIDDRPDRQGFPFEVVRELGELRQYYFSMVHPRPAGR